jgi:hypothetical protein
MHLFDPNGNSVESQTPFIVTVILLSLVTYALAGWGLWLVDRGYRRNETGGLAATKASECLVFLRCHGKNSEVV